MANILIIDDNKEWSRVLGETVEGLGHEASLAFTIREGLKAAASGTFDAVVFTAMRPYGRHGTILD